MNNLLVQVLSDDDCFDNASCHLRRELVRLRVANTPELQTHAYLWQQIRHEVDAYKLGKKSMTHEFNLITRLLHPMTLNVFSNAFRTCSRRTSINLSCSISSHSKINALKTKKRKSCLSVKWQQKLKNWYIFNFCL